MSANGAGGGDGALGANGQEGEGGAGLVTPGSHHLTRYADLNAMFKDMSSIRFDGFMLNKQYPQPQAVPEAV